MSSPPSSTDTQVPEAAAAAANAHDDDDDDVDEATPWYRTVSWHAVLLYGVIIGLATAYGVSQYREHRRQSAAAAVVARRRKLAERLNPAPGGRFRIDSRTPGQ